MGSFYLLFSCSSFFLVHLSSSSTCILIIDILFSIIHVYCYLLLCILQLAFFLSITVIPITSFIIPLLSFYISFRETLPTSPSLTLKPRNSPSPIGQAVTECMDEVKRRQLQNIIKTGSEDQGNNCEIGGKQITRRKKC